MAMRNSSFTKGWEGVHRADPTGVHGHSNRRRDKQPLFAPESGVSAKTSALLQRMGKSVGLTKDQLAAALGADTRESVVVDPIAAVPADRATQQQKRRVAALRGAGGSSGALGRSGGSIVAGRAPAAGTFRKRSVDSSFGKSANPSWGSGSGAWSRGKVSVPRVGGASARKLAHEAPSRPARKPESVIARETAMLDEEIRNETRAFLAPGAKRHVDASQKTKLQDAYLNDGAGLRVSHLTNPASPIRKATVGQYVVSQGIEMPDPPPRRAGAPPSLHADAPPPPRAEAPAPTRAVASAEAVDDVGASAPRGSGGASASGSGAGSGSSSVAAPPRSAARDGSAESSGPAKAPKSRRPKQGAKPDPEKLFDVIADEIEERRQFLEAMRAMGAAAQHEPRIAREIKERVQEMERLQKLIAAKYA